MPRGRKPKSASQGDIIASTTIGSGSTTSTSSSLVGQTISINLKRNSYYGVGDIWLSPENYWATIPNGMSAQEYEIITNSLMSGTIVEGKIFIPPVDKISNIPEKYWSIIARTGFETKEAKNEFSALIRKGADSGWTAIEIAQFCLGKENAGAKRTRVVNLLTQLIKNYQGPIQLYDPPDNKEGIKKVTVKADGTVEGETHSGKKVAKKMQAAPPEGHIAGTKSSEQAINEILG